MKKINAAIIALFTLLAVPVCFLVSVDVAERAGITEGPDVSEAIAAEGKNSAIAEQGGSGARSPSVAGGAEERVTSYVQISVFNEQGSAVPRATVWPTDAVERIVGSGDARRPLVSTDSLGRASVAISQLQNVLESSSSISIEKAGHATAVVPLNTIAQDRDVSVVLERAYGQKVRCVGPGGKPVAGVLVGLSQTRFDAASLPQLPEGCRAGTHPVSAIHISVTDASGVAVIPGIEKGTKYHLRAFSPSKGILDVTPAGSNSLPLDEIQIRWGPIVAAVARVEGDEVISRGFVLGPQLVTSGRAIWALAGVRRQLEAAFPESVVSVAVLDELIDDSREAELHVLLAEHGTVQLSVPMVPLDEVGHGQTINVGHSESGDAATVEARLAFVDAVGANPPIDEFTVRYDGLLAGHVPIRVGMKGLRLPRGTYELSTRNPWLREYLESTTLRVPGNNVVILAGSLRKCRIDVALDRWGHRPAYELQIDASGRHRSARIEPHEGSFETWLPLGKATTRVVIDGALVHEKEFEVTEDLGFSVQPVDVRVHL